MEIESAEESTINNRYKIIEKKGRGASAIVYLAQNLTTKKQYAVKILKEITPSFQNEIQMLEKVSSLNNPYIVNLIEYGEGPIKIGTKAPKNHQYFVLDYASKGEIFDYIYYFQKGLKEKYAKLIFKKILKGVQACHIAGICHRDLKMQNILVDEFFNPKICDFGFATEIKGKDGSGKLDQFLGTLNYAAPEIFLHRPYNGIKVDIFSLGVVLINLVTCKIGFVQATRKDKYYKYIMVKKYGQYWNSVKSIGEMSEDLKKLYIKMVSYNPDERPSIEEILNDPWMKEINDLNENEYKNLEKEIYEDFKEREKKVIESNENVTSSSNENMSIDNSRGLNEEDKEYFNLDLLPKYNLKTGLNMNNYIKINGNLNPNKFMNSLCNKIMSEYEDNCSIEPSKKTLKFNVIFKTPEEEEDEEKKDDEEYKKIEEELNKLGLENIDDFEDTIEQKDSIIQVKLFESVNGGYLVRFVKKGGEIEEYHKNLDKIIRIIKKIL